MSKNLSAKYHQKNKERLQKNPRERYQDLSKEKEKKHEKILQNSLRKVKFVEDRKKYYGMRKNVIL